jgi:hypothetical protein
VSRIGYGSNTLILWKTKSYATRDTDKKYYYNGIHQQETMSKITVKEPTKEQTPYNW